MLEILHILLIKIYTAITSKEYRFISFLVGLTIFYSIGKKIYTHRFDKYIFNVQIIDVKNDGTLILKKQKSTFTIKPIGYTLPTNNDKNECEKRVFNLYKKFIIEQYVNKDPKSLIIMRKNLVYGTFYFNTIDIFQNMENILIAPEVNANVDWCKF